MIKKKEAFGIRVKDIENDIYINSKEIEIKEESVISVDPSTTSLGMSILSRKENKPLYSLLIYRDKKQIDDVEFKVKFKVFLRDFIIENKDNLKHIVWEEPVFSAISGITAAALVRNVVEEIKIENRPFLNHIERVERNNQRWKKRFLSPVKVPNNKDESKKIVKNKVVEMYPQFSDLEYDETDAFAIGYVYIKELNGELESGESKKKTKPFKFNIGFVTDVNSDELEKYIMNYKEIPKKVRENGIEQVKIQRNTQFNNKIYETMGQYDRVVLAEFTSNVAGNIILEYELGNLIKENDNKTIYAIVWRKSRKS